MDEKTRNIVAIVAAVIVLGGVGYFLWSHAAPPEPTVPPGQTLHNPFGVAQPGAPGTTAAAPTPAPSPAPTASANMPPAANMPPPAGMPPGGMPTQGSIPARNTATIPATGTVDPKLGFGPSPGARIPGR